MKIKAYRGTRLSRALQMLEGKIPKKTSYWITDKDESRPYANVEKWNDKDEKWAILEATLEFHHSHIYYIPASEWISFEEKWIKNLLGRTGIYETEHFQVIIIPKENTESIKEAKIVEIV